MCPLEKNFNISKSDHTLKYFLSSIHEVIHKKIRIDEWCAALSVSKLLLDPDQAGVDAIRDEINSRDQEIKEDVAKFIRGQVARADLTAFSAPPMSAPSPEEASRLDESAVVDDGSADEQGSGPQSDETIYGSGEGLSPSDVSNDLDNVAIDLVELRTVYRDDSEVRLVIDHFANRENNQKVSPVDALFGALHRAKTPLSRHAVVRVFRSLDALGVGRFIPGRKGYASRFQWSEKSRSVREMASTQPSDQPEPLPMSI